MPQPWNENLKRLLTFTPPGTGSDELSSAMTQFLQAWNASPPSDAALDAAVADIASALNMDIAEARLAFAHFLQEEDDESHTEFKSKFVGSKQQLLFGHVVGDVLNMSHVFAAMLSPTGGMVGPGGFSFHVKGGVLGYHGVAHDAGGYLCREHNEAPGYEYIIDDPGDPCEDSPLAGQITGIAFWFKLLHLGWLNFLASSDLSSLASAPEMDIDSFLQPGRLSTSETTPPAPDDTDGIILNPAEVRFLQLLITRESDPADDQVFAQGLESLQRRDLVTGSEQEGFTVSDQLILATAVTLEPELILEASTPASSLALDDSEPTLRFYKWGDYIVEQTTPSQNQLRLAGLRDATHAQERLQHILTLSETDLDAVSLSLTGAEFDTAVSTAALDSVDPAAADPVAISDLSAALSSGQLVGSLRIKQFEGRTLANTRNLKFIKGTRATWLISQETQQGDQVDISLTTPATLGQQLGLSTSTG